MKDKKIKQNYYTTTELSKLLNISRQAVLKKIKNGQLEAEKIGRNYIIPKKEFSGVFGNDLTAKLKIEIEKGVTKVVREYGEVLKQLGNE